MCQAAARGIAPGVSPDVRTANWPRELELELTTQRLTTPWPRQRPKPLADEANPSAPAGAQAEAAATRLSPTDIARWLSSQQLPDDLLLTFAGHGDPLLHPNLPEILRAARSANPLSICVQTDLASDITPLLAAIADNLVDVITVTMYGHTRETYAAVAAADLHPAVMQNMQRLAEATRTRGGTPLVIPRLLKVRQTIPELEPFFDFWIEQCGWAVIDGPTDLAGTAEFRAVVDMAPPKRKPCRRIWDRFLIRADSTATACDQDITGKLTVGSVQSMSIQQMWTALQTLRNQHAAAQWNQIDPCKPCREWHRA